MEEIKIKTLISSKNLTMRLLFSDIHITESNLVFKRKILDQILTLASKEKITNLDFGGDWFESRKAQPLQTLTFTDNFFRQIKEEDLTLTIIPGNHDKLDYLSVDSFLDPFTFYPNIFLIKELESKNSISYLPFFQEGSEILDNELSKFSQIKTPILIAHFGIGDYKSDMGDMIKSPISVGKFSQFKRVFVGHYHNRSEMKNITYIGSTNPSDFGEDNKKGCCIYDEETGDYGLINLSFPKFYSFNFSTKEGVDKIYKKVEEINKEFKNTDGEVNNIRVVLEGSKEEIKSFNQTPIKKMGIRLDSKIENKEIDREDVQELKLTSGKIQEFFNDWLLKEDIQGEDQEIGLHYFNKIK